MTLTFNAGNHRYRLDGKAVPSVTGIIGKGIPKPALPYWAAKSVAEFVADRLDDVPAWQNMPRAQLVAMLKGAPWAARDAAALRGTDIHNLAERVVSGEEVDVPPELAPVIEGYVRWLDAFAVEPLLTECSVASRMHWYAGRFDLLARIAGETWMLDVKSSSGVYGETALQVGAYAGAQFYVKDDAPDVEVTMPHVERIGVIHVTPEGSHLYDLGSPTVGHAAFLAAKAVADGEPWRAVLIGDPVQPAVVSA